ncbi:Lrp/AsnC family transcriptional regulator [Candidatus Woesearchaeota archaeon]|nr:Lrp/AsnC family transcriptional regulator [Candidatus Woesearchaeota archaeon]
METLDAKDCQLLYELSHNARQSYSALAKKTRLKKDTAAYRIKRMEERGIISGHTIFSSFARLGYQIFKSYIKLQGVAKEDVTAMVEWLVKNKLVGWVALSTGAWDLIIGALVKTPQEFYEFKHAFEYEFHDAIYQISTTLMVNAAAYSRDYLVKDGEAKQALFFTEQRSTLLSEKDKAILHLLSKNARLSTAEIARQTKLTPRIVSYRIKQLEKEGLILIYRTSLNLDTIGYHYYKAFVTLQRVTPERYNAFLEYCRLHPNIIHNVECLGEWDLEPEFEVENADEFGTIISEMRSTFADVIKRIETVMITKEAKYGYIPF